MCEIVKFVIFVKNC